MDNIDDTGYPYSRTEKIFLFYDEHGAITVVLRHPITQYLTEQERKDIMTSAMMMNTNFIGEFDWKHPIFSLINQVLRQYFFISKTEYFEEEKYCIVYVKFSNAD